MLTGGEVRTVLGRLDGVPQIVAELLYGSGRRLLECLQLRVKDVDFGGHMLMVRGGKAAVDRRMMLALAAEPALRRELERVRARHARDLGEGAGAAPRGV